ncbi:MAG TPA: LamG domain-containing protein, partial [Caulobacter sp.]|nr:LamG domain-containing protein [Caulobacter sp.]
ALPGAAGATIPLNIQVKDPIWPGRNMIDVSVSVKAGEARTVWLDMRDRILTPDSLYLSIAADSADFGPKALDGTKIRLVLKDRDKAKVEHVQDRLNQVKDNWAFLVEEHTTSKRQGLYRRLYADISDLLRVDPDNQVGREYWGDITYGSQGWPAFDQPKPTDGTPLWAFRQLEDLKLVTKFVDWWIDERQVDFGDFGGGLSDDTDLLQQWPGLALMGVQPGKITTSLNRLTDAVYKNGMFTEGLSTIVTDELHAYEEGINSNSEAMYVNYGDPLTVERLFTTVKALPRVIDKNPAGHVHFNTNWYSGKISYREGPWEWQKPYSFGVTHPPILISDYNNDPTARGLVIGLADGYLAHVSKKDGSYPNEINWRSDAERGGTVLQGSGADGPFQVFWAAYRLTGDAKYLTPIQWRISKNGIKSLGSINENALTTMNLGAANKDAIVKMAAKGGALERYAAWSLTGDKKPLEDLYADEIQWNVQHMHMLTEGHWWSDRVELPSDILQRSRLGGIANKRGQMTPGHVVSWRFDNADGTDVALLVKDATKTSFKVIAYNRTDKPVTGVMTGWNVAPGVWSLSQGFDTNGDDVIDGAPETATIAFERSLGTKIALSPRQTVIIDMKLTKAGDDPAKRADLGVGRGDVVVKGGAITAKVHSLGAQDAAPAKLELVDTSYKVLDSAVVPALEAPLDLLPKTASVKLRIPAGVKAQGLRVRIVTSQPQNTRLNDEVVLP